MTKWELNWKQNKQPPETNNNTKQTKRELLENVFQPKQNGMRFICISTQNTHTFTKRDQDTKWVSGTGFSTKTTTDNDTKWEWIYGFSECRTWNPQYKPLTQTRFNIHYLTKH